MNIIETSYKSISGYNDVSPGITSFRLSVAKLEDGTVISQPIQNIAPVLNEIQIDGDPDLRRSFLPPGDDGSSILFLDDPDYDALRERRMMIATKDLPLVVDIDFVRRWAAMSFGTPNVIELGESSGINYVDGGNWGNIQDSTLRRAMLNNIFELDVPTKLILLAETDETQFSINYVAWRDTLPSRITYQLYLEIE